MIVSVQPAPAAWGKASKEAISSTQSFTKCTQRSRWPQPNEGTCDRHIAPDPSAAPQALQYVCQHRSAASQSKDSNADTRGCTQNTQMATGPRLCLLPNVGNPRRTIKRVAHGVSAAPDHLRALRASAYICVESFLVPRAAGLATRAETIAASRSIIGRGVDLRRQ